jgi:hypothetical protein
MRRRGWALLTALTLGGGRIVAPLQRSRQRELITRVKERIMSSRIDGKTVLSSWHATAEHTNRGVSSWITIGTAALTLAAAAPQCSGNAVPGAHTISQQRTETLSPALREWMRKAATSRPSAVVAMLSILQPETAPFPRAAAHNSIYLEGTPTQRTVDLILARAERSALVESLDPLPMIPFAGADAVLRIHWEISEEPGGTALMRINASILARSGCGIEVNEPLEPETLVSFRRSPGGSLAWTPSQEPETR